MKIEKNLSFGMIEKISIMLCGFITRTCVIKFFGIDYVGLGTLFASILQILNFAELGLESAIVFKLYSPVLNEDVNTINRLLNYYRKFCFAVGIIVSVVSFALIPFLHLLINGDVPNGINIYILFGINILNSIVGYFFYGYQSVLFSATGRLDVVSCISCIISVLQCVFQVFSIINLHSYYVYALLVPAATLSKLLVQHLFLKKQYSNYVPKGTITKEERREIFAKIIGLLGYKINSIVVFSSDSIIISVFLGLSLLGKYNNYYYVITALNSIIIIILNSIKPHVGQSIAKYSCDRVYGEFKAITVIYVAIISFFVSGLIAIFQDFIILWIGDDFLLKNSFVILLGVYFWVWKFLDIILLYQDASGIWNRNKTIPYIQALVNLTLNILFVQYIGLYGIVLSTILSMLLVLVTVTKSVFKECFLLDKIDKVYFYKIFVISIIVIIVSYYSTRIVDYTIDSILFRIFCKGILCLFSTIAIFWIMYFRNSNLLNMIKNRRKNKNV